MMKVLIVDDSEFIRGRCSRLLGERGYGVLEAANGKEALEQYRKCRPDAVLLDIIMPLMDGIVTLREMKKIDPGAKVAMVTAVDQRPAVLNALHEGARDYIVKPFREGRVLDTVQRLVSHLSE